jgi:hypothetical protein
MAHNTLTIDGQSSSASAGPFSWQTIAKCDPSKWIAHERFDFVKGSHDGYRRLPDPVEHSRSIFFFKNDYWIVRDQLQSSAPHQADLWFHFSANAKPIIEASAADSAAVVTEELGIHVMADGGLWRREDGAVSECYGAKQPARVYAYTAEVSGNTEIFTLLLPRSVAVPTTYDVREVEAIGGKAFEISDGNGFDVVMIRRGAAGQTVETERLSSDFEWTWARFVTREDRVPVELIALDGSGVDLEGRTILKWQNSVEYLVAKRTANGFAGQTSEGNFTRELPPNSFETSRRG